MVGILLSYWEGNFLGAMLVSGRVINMVVGRIVASPVVFFRTYHQDTEPLSRSSCLKACVYTIVPID